MFTKWVIIAVPVAVEFFVFNLKTLEWKVSLLFPRVNSSVIGNFYLSPGLLPEASTPVFDPYNMLLPEVLFCLELSFLKDRWSYIVLKHQGLPIRYMIKSYLWETMFFTNLTPRILPNFFPSSIPSPLNLHCHEWLIVLPYSAPLSNSWLCAWNNFTCWDKGNLLPCWSPGWKGSRRRIWGCWDNRCGLDDLQMREVLVLFFLYYVCAQSCLPLCDPVDRSPPGSSVHGISLSRKLKWVAISYSRGSSPPRVQIWVSCISCGR